MADYRILPHTADIMILVRGKTLEELFITAGEALISIIADRRKVRRREKKVTRVVGHDLEDLLFQFLKWVHYLYYVDDFIVRTVNGNMDEGMISFECEGWGESLNPEIHEVKAEVKAVTFHGLKIEKSEKSYSATFVLDV